MRPASRSCTTAASISARHASWASTTANENRPNKQSNRSYLPRSCCNCTRSDSFSRRNASRSLSLASARASLVAALAVVAASCASAASSSTARCCAMRRSLTRASRNSSMVATQLATSSRKNSIALSRSSTTELKRSTANACAKRSDSLWSQQSVEINDIFKQNAPQQALTAVDAWHSRRRVKARRGENEPFCATRQSNQRRS